MYEIPEKIWDEVEAVLHEVSDEIGEDNLGEEYLLKYEGWSGFCVHETWTNIGVEQLRTGTDDESNEAEGMIEEACYEYAEDQSYKIIEDEWKSELSKRGFYFVDGGYDSGGLYGRTWALFKKAKE